MKDWLHLQESQCLAQLAVSESGFLFDPRSGQSFTLNPTALEALKLCRSGTSFEAAIAQLQEQYLSSSETISLGLESFARQIGRFLL